MFALPNDIWPNAPSHCRYSFQDNYKLTSTVYLQNWSFSKLFADDLDFVCCIKQKPLLVHIPHIFWQYFYIFLDALKQRQVVVQDFDR